MIKRLPFKFVKRMFNAENPKEELTWKLSDNKNVEQQRSSASKLIKKLKTLS